MGNTNNTLTNPDALPSELSKREKQIREVKDCILIIIVVFLIGMAISIFIKPVVVHEDSMKNTIHDKDVIILFTKAYKKDETPARGDIVVFRNDGANKNLIKRVIGAPGDVIEIQGGKVSRNGQILNEPYAIGKTTGESECTRFIVPDDHLFVMGDNREVSLDSRSSDVGFVSKDSIMGRAAIRLLPIDDMETF